MNIHVLFFPVRSTMMAGASRKSASKAIMMVNPVMIPKLFVLFSSARRRIKKPQARMMVVKSMALPVVKRV